MKFELPRTEQYPMIRLIISYIGGPAVMTFDSTHRVADVRPPQGILEESIGVIAYYCDTRGKIADMARLFAQGEDAVVKEFEVVFERVLDAKLRTDGGRALIAAKLADSRKPTDPTVVQNVLVQPPATVAPQYQVTQ